MISDFKAGTKVCQAVLLRVQKIGNSSNGGVFAVYWKITAAKCRLLFLKLAL